MKNIKILLGAIAMLFVSFVHAQITPDLNTETWDLPNGLIDVTEANRTSDSTFTLTGVSFVSYKNYPYTFTRDSFQMGDQVMDNKADRFQIDSTFFQFGDWTLYVKAKNQRVIDNPSYIYGTGSGHIFNPSEIVKMVMLSTNMTEKAEKTVMNYNFILLDKMIEKLMADIVIAAQAQVLNQTGATATLSENGGSLNFAPGLVIEEVPNEDSLKISSSLDNSSFKIAKRFDPAPLEALVANNTTSINTLSTGVTSNAANITANDADIANNASGIAANTTGIATNGTAIAANDADIANNASGIATNTTGIATNGTAIAANDADIATNASGITTNTTGVATNGTDIAANDADIATNASGIATNTTGIATNGTAIAANDADIANNASGIATNTTGIATNGTAIAANDADIANNASGIATNTTGIATNGTAIAANDADIANNASGIATNTTGIATNGTAIAANDADIANNASGIAANTTGIATNGTAIAANDADIATNASGIATNTTGIATNGTAIAANDADIATNASGIAANDTELADHETRVGILESLDHLKDTTIVWTKTGSPETYVVVDLVGTNWGGFTVSWVNGIVTIDPGANAKPKDITIQGSHVDLINSEHLKIRVSENIPGVNQSIDGPLKTRVIQSAYGRTQSGQELFSVMEAPPVSLKEIRVFSPGVIEYMVNNQTESGTYLINL